MHWFAVLAAFVSILLGVAPANAQSVVGHRTIITTSWVEEWDPQTRQWVRVESDAPLARARARVETSVAAAKGFSANPPSLIHASALATSHPSQSLAGQRALYGPFVVLDERRAAVIGSTDSASPQHFDAMMRDFPNLAKLEMIEAPGTSNDIANLAVGRRIREHGLATHVPNGGSVRSGAVELFLAGVERTMEHGAQFAVHSWLDNYGREPDDFAPDAPANRLYLDYYVEMGMSEARAKAFYAMTNSVPHNSAKWLGARDMEPWLRAQGAVIAHKAHALPGVPRIAYGDLNALVLSYPKVTFAKAFLDS